MFSQLTFDEVISFYFYIHYGKGVHFAKYMSTMCIERSNQQAIKNEVFKFCSFHERGFLKVFPREG